MKVIITDAYSASNLGDLELVRLTSSIAREKYGVPPTILATDPISFSEFKEHIVFKPLSRLQWHQRGRLRKPLWLFVQCFNLFFVLITSKFPPNLRIKLTKTMAKLSKNEWLHEWSDATHIIGVGGGYLGDRYQRETCVTLLLYWSALLSGKKVETMPISVSSIKSPIICFLLRRTGQVTWRARENTTKGLLESVGVSAHLVPDLAWVTSDTEILESRRIDLLIAPVGAPFYSDHSGPPKAWSFVLPHLETLPPNAQISLLPMHTYSQALNDGGDENACNKIGQLINAHRPDLRVSVIHANNYQDVRAATAHSKVALCERLHAGLAALTTGTRTFIVGYEPKHLGVLQLANLEGLANSFAESEMYSSDQIMAAAREQRAKVYMEVL